MKGKCSRKDRETEGKFVVGCWEYSKENPRGKFRKTTFLKVCGKKTRVNQTTDRHEQTANATENVFKLNLRKEIRETKKNLNKHKNH